MEWPLVSGFRLKAIIIVGSLWWEYSRGKCKHIRLRPIKCHTFKGTFMGNLCATGQQVRHITLILAIRHFVLYCSSISQLFSFTLADTFIQYLATGWPQAYSRYLKLMPMLSADVLYMLDYSNLGYWVCATASCISNIGDWVDATAPCCSIHSWWQWMFNSCRCSAEGLSNWNPLKMQSLCCQSTSSFSVVMFLFFVCVLFLMFLIWGTGNLHSILCNRCISVARFSFSIIHFSYQLA